MRKTYTLGKVDYNNTSRKDCEAQLEWELDGGKFSMSGGIWNPRKTDYITCGQCVDEIAALFPNDKQAQSMLAVWQEWHLNDMKAGSQRQEAYLKADTATWESAKAAGVQYYDYAKAALFVEGLEPDAEYLHEGKPYSYGSAWLKRDLPPEVLAEILNWKETADYTLDKETKERKPKKSDFEKFLEKNFTVSCEYEGFENNMDCYRCTIERIDSNGKTGKKMKTSWKQGTAHRIDNIGRQWSEREERADFSSFGKRQFSQKKSAPSIVKLFDAVVRDALAYSDNRDFLDFAACFGYEDMK